MVQSTTHGSMKRVSRIRRFLRLVKANATEAMVFAVDYIVKHRELECVIMRCFSIGKHKESSHPIQP